MPSDSIIFAGVDISSGRRPLTFAALDEGLNIKLLEKWDWSEALACLSGYENAGFAINIPSGLRRQELVADFKDELLQAGFQPFSPSRSAKQWLEIDAQDCFHALSGHKLFPRRTLQGRLQRTAILYEQGLQVIDPVDLFEEITRFKLIQGILPLENLPSPKELDALVGAYLAWMSANRPGQVVLRGDFVLPAPE
jgi:hypothetical protein